MLATKYGPRLFEAYAERHLQRGCATRHITQPPVCPMYNPGRSASIRKPYTNLYAKLGLSSEASADEIRSRYKALEGAYRPGGAYLDDVMHLAFSEISNAAAILSNPKTRRLYDRGYVDETGRPTEIGLAARRSRIRKVVYATALFAVGLAGLAVFTIAGEGNRGPRHTESAGGPDMTRIAQEPSATPPIAAGPPEQTSSCPTTQLNSRNAAAPAKADARDYLPPETAQAPKMAEAPKADVSPSWRGGPILMPRVSVPPKTFADRAIQLKQRERNAPNLERRRVARLSKAAPQTLQAYIWFGGPAPASGRTSQTLKSAHCLACLTDHQADCSRACP